MADEGVAVGVCSWSLQAGSAWELADRVHACGLSAVQLALDPVRTGAMPLPEVTHVFGQRDVRVLSGMMATEGEDYSTLESIRRTGGVVPDETWEANEAAAIGNARIAASLGIRLVTLHAGFVPHEAGTMRRQLVDRLRRIADIFGEHDVKIALETGQESAQTLLELVRELHAHDVGVNFDPANMILYGMGDPVAAVDVLAPYVRQVHIKDAISSETPGEWGQEVRVGDGFVEWDAFFAMLRERNVECDLVIEREAGDDRIHDVRAAVAMLMTRAAG